LSYLLDTNVISELRKGKAADPAVTGWIEAMHGEGFFLSVLVVGELRKGIERLAGRDPESARALDDWLRGVQRRFEGRVIPIDTDIAEEWGRMSASDSPSVIDGLLAATALVKDLTLVTRNTADVERTGVALVNPFVLK